MLSPPALLHLLILARERWPQEPIFQSLLSQSRRHTRAAITHPSRPYAVRLYRLALIPHGQLTVSSMDLWDSSISKDLPTLPIERGQEGAKPDSFIYNLLSNIVRGTASQCCPNHLIQLLAPLRLLLRHRPATKPGSDRSTPPPNFLHPRNTLWRIL
jgi:hypothetical protein